LKAATSWWRPDAHPIPPVLGWRQRVSRLTLVDISPSTTGSRRRTCCLGYWRVRGQSTVHACVGERLPHHLGQSSRRRSNHARPARALLHVHRLAAGWGQESHPPRRGYNLASGCAQLRRAKRDRPNSAPTGCHMDAAMHMTHGLAMSAGNEENGCGLPYRDAPAPPAVEHWCALASRWCVFLAWSLP
jgi:hypothetical protein